MADQTVSQAVDKEALGDLDQNSSKNPAAPAIIYLSHRPC